jgi:hypothetical protein
LQGDAPRAAAFGFRCIMLDDLNFGIFKINVWR